ncbi:hypothetical protein Sjap_007430 [Stephania japonica]|uniref:Pectinesterase n=1 Tax=Stephania japonica TaxID=461633 RepID=A0AAP0JMK7_9MAGN
MTLPISAILLLLPLLLSSPPPTTSTTTTPVDQELEIARSACSDVLHRDLCLSTLSTFPNLASQTLPQIISATVNHTVDEVEASATNCSGIKSKFKNRLDPIQKRALDDCLELFQYTIAELDTALKHIIIISRTTKSNNKTRNSRRIIRYNDYNDLETLLSGAITNQYTCLDGFAYGDHDEHVRKLIEKRLYKISHLVSNSLAMLKKLKPTKESSILRRSDDLIDDGFPGWMSRRDRRLIGGSSSSGNATGYDVVVAKDGSGNYSTIGEAVEAAPSESKDRFVIYIKAGAYLENVEVGRKKTKLMFVGDGMGKTVVKGSRNVVDGWTTFRSATVAVVGNGFIARDMSFENSAGPSKHQAVALRSGSDLSAFYRCSFVGYQDTLYVHSLRQFYKECDIYGTVDFIFGNAAAVLQDCNLYARRPNPNQRNIFTAQGREDPNQNTGISIIGGKVTAAADLIPVMSTFETYLGRPWKEYSRTVFILTKIDDVVNPKGWLEWDGEFALKTLYYGEYMNRGSGSNTSGRVTWPGYRVLNTTEASAFTVEAFIQGRDWLPAINIPYAPGLNLSSQIRI